MANKKQSAATKKTSESPAKVTRLKADDTAKIEPKQAKDKPVTATKEPTAKKPIDKTNKRKNPLRALGGYFAGAWYELKQVHWPDRKATWSLTVAVLLFSAFFVGLIIVLDYIFQWLFEFVIS